MCNQEPAVVVLHSVPAGSCFETDVFCGSVLSFSSQGFMDCPREMESSRT